MLPATLFVAAALVLAAGCGGTSESASDTDTTAGSDTAGTPVGTLVGSVGPGFDIALDQAEVAAGTYTLKVDDQSDAHNFHLTGPGGVDVTTEVSAVGTETFTVDLEAGTYTFVCDPHASFMKGTLDVK